MTAYQNSTFTGSRNGATTKYTQQISTSIGMSIGTCNICCQNIVVNITEVYATFIQVKGYSSYKTSVKGVRFSVSK